MEVKINQLDDRNFIDKEGDYIFEVVEAEVKESSAGNPMVQFTLRAKEGEIRHTAVLVEKALWRYGQMIKAIMGYTPGLMSEEDKEEVREFIVDWETVHTKLIGTTFGASVIKEIYSTTDALGNKEDKESYKIKSFFPAS